MREREIGIGVTEAGLLNSWPAAAHTHTHTLRHINMKDDRRQRSVVVASWQVLGASLPLAPAAAPGGALVLGQLLACKIYAYLRKVKFTPE